MPPVSARTLPTLAAFYRSGKFRASARADGEGAAKLVSASSSAQSSTLTSPSAQASSTPASSSLLPPVPLNERVAVWRGSITALAVDAIVNAANSSLMGGGGVDGAIHQAAGPELQRACAALHGCATGDAKVTDGFRLPCRKIVHTVGPVYHAMPAAEARQLLASCYRRSLEEAVRAGCRSIAFCAISTGVYGYPPAAAARVAATTVRAFLTAPEGAAMERVVFVAFDGKDMAAYAAVLPEVFPPEDEATGTDDAAPQDGSAKEAGKTADKTTQTDTAEASAPKEEVDKDEVQN